MVWISAVAFVKVTPSERLRSLLDTMKGSGNMERMEGARAVLTDEQEDISFDDDDEEAIGMVYSATMEVALRGPLYQPSVREIQAAAEARKVRTDRDKVKAAATTAAESPMSPLAALLMNEKEIGMPVSLERITDENTESIERAVETLKYFQFEEELERMEPTGRGDIVSRRVVGVATEKITFAAMKEAGTARFALQQLVIESSRSIAQMTAKCQAVLTSTKTGRAVEPRQLIGSASKLPITQRALACSK